MQTAIQPMLRKADKCEKSFCGRGHLGFQLCKWNPDDSRVMSLPALTSDLQVKWKAAQEHQWVVGCQGVFKNGLKFVVCVVYEYGVLHVKSDKKKWTHVNESWRFWSCKLLNRRGGR